MHESEKDNGYKAQHSHIYRNHIANFILIHFRKRQTRNCRMCQTRNELKSQCPMFLQKSM